MRKQIHQHALFPHLLLYTSTLSLHTDLLLR